MLDLSTFLRRGRTLLLALLAAMLAIPAFAQTDPPGRIGRIAWTSGDVYLNNPDTGELGAAPLNQPLTSGDIVSTGPGARAEIQIGAMTLRLDSGSRIEFDRIDDDQVRVRLDDGRLIAKLPTDDTRRDFVLETESGQGRFLPRDTGIYRFDQDHGSGSTTATAYFGTLRFEGRDTALDINAGESARLWVDGAGQFNYRMVQGVRDEFTQWSAARDQRQRASASSRYVSPEMTGVQDLDTYGDWSEYPEYGAVWFPRAVAVDWAPYRTGHWAWVAPWGWTWIGHEPWGFAPFHYGRWVRIRGVWAWAPGVRVVRPVYAPALVVWIGTPNVSFSLSIGSAPPVGWFPLAPREVYVPFYRSTTVYVQQVNAPHVTHIHNLNAIVSRPQEVVRETRFVHRDEPRALSVAPSDAFRQRRPDTRITPRPGDVREFREFRDRPVHVAPPAPEPRRATETERRPRPDQRPQAEQQGQRPPQGQVIETPPRRERPQPEVSPRQLPAPRMESTPPRREPEARPEVRRQDDTIRTERPRERREETIRQAPPMRSEPPRPAVQRQEPPPEVRREPPRPAVQRAEPPAAPPVMRQPPQERPREFQRPPEARREMRIETRPERREERVQPPPRVEQQHQEKREAREEKRDDRRERGNRPGEPDRR